MDIAFNRRIVELSNNGFLICTVQDLHLFERIFKVYRIVFSSVYAMKSDDNLAYTHEKIFNALRTGDGNEAERMMRFHVQEAKKRTI